MMKFWSNINIKSYEKDVMENIKLLPVTLFKNNICSEINHQVYLLVQLFPSRGAKKNAFYSLSEIGKAK